jgi:hypothetical protein
MVIPTGILRVEGVFPGGVFATVLDQFNRILVGDMVRGLPPYTPRPEGAAERSVGGAEVTVIGLADERALQTLGHWVFLDAGASQGISIGDEFVGTGPANDGWAGRVKVVAVLREISTARIVDLEDPVLRAGVRLRPDRRVP